MGKLWRYQVKKTDMPPLTPNKSGIPFYYYPKVYKDIKLCVFRQMN